MMVKKVELYDEQYEPKFRIGDMVNQGTFWKIKIVKVYQKKGKSMLYKAEAGRTQVQRFENGLKYILGENYRKGTYIGKDNDWKESFITPPSTWQNT